MLQKHGGYPLVSHQLAPVGKQLIFFAATPFSIISNVSTPHGADTANYANIDNTDNNAKGGLQLKIQPLPHWGDVGEDQRLGSTATAWRY